jgi:hypothetical protein
MTIARGARVAIALAAFTAAAASGVVAEEEGSDIRGLTVGIAAAELPTAGFTGFTCAATGEALPGWPAFARCPATAADSLREVAVRYDEAAQPWAAVNSAWEGTKLAGHPVLLSVLFDDTGTAQAIRAVTDPEAPPYLRKKAYLLYIRVMGRYGRDGWACVDAKPRDREPVGGIFIDRYCEKRLPDRTLVLQTDLYRVPGQAGRDYTDAARFEIWRGTGPRRG